MRRGIETLVLKVREIEQEKNNSTKLAEAVARYYAKLLAYKDEYEVARLYTDGAFRKKIEAMFEGDYKLVFHLAPPLLAKPDPRTGEPAKMTFGPWVLKLFGFFQNLKGLRGTALDIFGRTEERRMERALIEEYEQTVETLLAGLTRENHALAVEIASLPETIRGYGHIKAKSVRGRAQEARRTARALPRRAGPRRRMRRRGSRPGVPGGDAACPGRAGADRGNPHARARGRDQRHLHAAHLSARRAPAAARREARSDQRAGFGQAHLPAPVRRRHRAGRAAVQFAEAALRGAARLPRIGGRGRVQARLRAVLRPGEPPRSPRSRIDNRRLLVWDLREGADADRRPVLRRGRRRAT